jgi:hypothetical protein
VFTAWYVLRSAHTVYFVFCVALRTNSDYFTVVFITETECVYCAVRTGSLNKTQIQLSVQRAEEAKQSTNEGAGLSTKQINSSWWSFTGSVRILICTIWYSTHSTLTYHEFRNAVLLHGTGKTTRSIISRRFQEVGHVAGIGHVKT